VTTTHLLLSPFSSSIGVVTKKVMATIVTFFKCFVSKKIMTTSCCLFFFFFFLVWSFCYEELLIVH
jgi:hypothetical protein